MTAQLDIVKALTIAGIDPSGGAGVLADIKTFSALGAYGCGVVCALTAQNTQAVTGIQATPSGFHPPAAGDAVRGRGDRRRQDRHAGHAPRLSRAVAEGLDEADRRAATSAHRVLDPVMVAKSGDSAAPKSSAIGMLHRGRACRWPRAHAEPAGGRRPAAPASARDARRDAAGGRAAAPADERQRTTAGCW